MIFIRCSLALGNRLIAIASLGVTDDTNVYMILCVVNYSPEQVYWIYRVGLNIIVTVLWYMVYGIAQEPDIYP